MRYAKWTLAAAILLMAATAVWAQCPTCFSEPVQAPCLTCPAPCPLPQACPQACACPCPAAVPAAIGAGPAAFLPCDTCEFDRVYAGSMYAQNSVVIAVTQYGGQRARDGNLRDISGEIHEYLTSANSKLQSWYGVVACSIASPDCARADAIIAQLAATPASCFDAVYAKTLSQLLQQSDDADAIGGQRALTPQMRQQAQFLTGKEANWAFRLDRWVADNGATTR